MQSVQVTPPVEFCPAFSAGKKITELQQVHLWAVLLEDQACPSTRVIEKMAETYEALSISVRHVNRLREQWGLSRGKGRPRGTKSAQAGEGRGGVVKLTPHVSFVGVHMFTAWMESRDDFGQIVRLLQQRIHWYRAAYPESDFALLHHTEETLLRRFQALFYAPLFGIGKLTEFDVTEHPLDTLIGRSYQSSTLNQFLGQLERIEAGETLLPALVPADAGQAGEICYVDGHMIAFWTRRSMHKGKITMIGRIMAGSQAVIAHTQDGQALFVAYHPPDIRLPHIIVQYCQRIVRETGIEVFVIDREVNSVGMAQAFEDCGLGLLSMLDKNEYHGLNSWEVTRQGVRDDDSVVYEGRWAPSRADDPRHFVLVETQERVLAYWGTSKVKEVLAPLQWPEVYRQRTEVQEFRFKQMKAHGALDINYGIKTVVGPDRHQQRAREKLEEAQAKAQQKVLKKEQLLKTQHAKVAESQEKNHTIRLEQRQRRVGELQKNVQKATEKTSQIEQQLSALEPPRERADRDFRKQTIMTIRTLLLENALLSFLAALCAILKEPISLECLLKLVFERGGACLETQAEFMYWINTTGLSVAYRELLGQIVKGMCAMNLTHRGKPIRVRLREAPT